MVVKKRKNKNPNTCSITLDYWSWNKVIVPCLEGIYRDKTKNQEDMMQWCKDYTSHKWFVNVNKHFFFEDEDDAILFKLTWM